MGIIHSLRPHQEFNRPCVGLIIGLQRRKRTRQKGSERSDSEVKGAQQNHQEFYDWFDFAWELYIPFARTRNQADQNGRFYF